MGQPGAKVDGRREGDCVMDWKSVISTVAPWIGTTLGGPLGGLAVTAVAEALGLSDKTEDAIKAAITGATPEYLLALKNADQMFAVQMQELGFKNQQAIAALAVENTKDARAMQVATRTKIPALLAVLITVGFFSILIGLLSGMLTVADNQPLMILLGALSAAWGAVMNYYFGSTAGGQAKTEMIARAKPVNLDK
jgi:hypothetical protein